VFSAERKELEPDASMVVELGYVGLPYGVRAAAREAGRRADPGGARGDVIGWECAGGVLVPGRGYQITSFARSFVYPAMEG
jgi:hypothetical protein